jgi:hypothetical protein
MAVTIPDTPEMLQRCICGGCPSYNRCMQDNQEGLYCARSKSECEFERSGCICGVCPLASEYDLDQLFYCATGAPK